MSLQAYSSSASGGAGGGDRTRALGRLNEQLVGCRRCPRLVSWREHVARERRASFRDQEYWGRPVPGFGDVRARIMLLGLAPAAHGANRTGRMFTGDRSGDFLFGALHRLGLASAADSVDRHDSLRLRDVYITAAVRCAPPANRPTPAERESCLPYTAAELEILDRVRVVVCLGAFAWDAALRLPTFQRRAPRPRLRFAHGAQLAIGDHLLLGCFHPSQQNTFTGRLTAEMIDAVLLHACELAGVRVRGWR